VCSVHGFYSYLWPASFHRGVENMLKHYIPEVISLVGEDDEKAEEQGYTPYFPKNKEPEWEKLAGHRYE